MKTRAARIRDSCSGWLIYAFITNLDRYLDGVNLIVVGGENERFIPLLPYLNPIWFLSALKVFLENGPLLFPFYFASYALRDPDFFGFYAFRLLGFHPAILQIDKQNWTNTVVGAVLLYVTLRLLYGRPAKFPNVMEAIMSEPQDQLEAKDEAAVLETEEPRMDKFLIPPLLFPAKTTHTRFFPKKHFFAYSYFYVGIPVGWRGRSGTALSADVERVPTRNRKYGWFDVNSADYLKRTTAKVSLETKLRTYLRGEGIKDEDWSFAYLCTAPRFLGYSFNPVSFWYIYGHRSELKMMLLEVNNTFDERRMYLLKADDDVNGKFKKSWTKDFHVSPFNSRKGSYSLQATNPYHPGKSMETSFDNLITLRSSKNHTKLVARVFSEGPAMDPASITRWQIFKLIAGWFWVGFMTFPRILYEAFKLFFAIKLHVWYRPEVMATSLGRRSTAEEKIVEGCFSKYIKFLAERSDMAIKVVYHPPGDLGDSQIWRSKAAKDSDENVQTVEIDIPSPAFYSRLIHYPHLTEAFNREGFCTDEKNRTILLSKADLLDLLLQEDLKRKGIGKTYSAWEQWRWNVLKDMRCPPPAVSYEEKPVNAPKPGIAVEDIRPPRLSQLDRFVMERVTADEAAQYRSLVTKTFIAHRYALGLEPLVSLADYVLRIVLVVVAYLATSVAFASSKATVAALAGADVWLARDQLNLLVAVCGSMAGRYLVHTWSAVKGTTKA